MQSIYESINNLGKTSKLMLAAFAFMSVLSFGSGRAHAATLNVSGGCTVPIAINSVNAGANQSGCTASGSYGTNDTISISAGTHTLGADLPSFTEPIVVTGDSTDTTIIDANGFRGFHADFSSDAPSTRDITIQNLSITGARASAIFIEKALTVTMDSLDISDSAQAVFVRGTNNMILTNSILHDNVEGSDGSSSVAGAYFEVGSTVSEPESSILVDNTLVTQNDGDVVGIQILAADNLPATSIIIQNTVVMDNQAKSFAGLNILQSYGPASPGPVNLSVDATTIANNTVDVATPQVVSGNATAPVLAGFLFSGVLTDSHHLKNVTVAYNTVNNPSPDNRLTVAGFVASIGITGGNLNILNTTVVGNQTNQGSPRIPLPAFYAIKIGLDETFTPSAIVAGTSAQNVLIAHNSFNDTPYSCGSDIDTTLFGIDLGIVDSTPLNMGNNMVDDQTCTGYNFIPNLYDTIDHQVTDNGGPVPTIRLLPSSPAINAGGSVLGITTDARGVARNSCPSVGAFQFEGAVCAATTTNANAGGAAAPNTGAKSASTLMAVVASVLGLAILGYAVKKRA